MSWERALEADARIAAKNSVLIRAALRQSFDAERAYQGYMNTTPNLQLNLVQQRARARAWAIINLRINLEPLKAVVERVWAEAYLLGDAAAQEALLKAKEQQKADVRGPVDWSKWKPGDEASSLWVKKPGMLRLLQQAQGFTWKSFSDTTLNDIGNAIGEAIALGLDARASAKLISNHVASPARALSIAITEQNRAISAATVQRYREVGLQSMEWLVFEPCDKCAQNANVVVRIGQSFPSGDTKPPAHPHCRCALAPVIPGFDDPENTAGAMAEITATPEVQEEITVAQGPTIGGISENKWFETQKRYSQNLDLPESQQPLGEQRLAAAYEVAGYNKTPQVLSSTEFEKAALKPGSVRVYRGLNGPQASEYIKEYKTGQHYAGTGVFGNGTYTSTSWDTARVYASGEKNIMELLITDESKFINYKELKELGKTVKADLESIINEGIKKAKADMKAAGYTNLSNPIWQAWIEKQVQYDEIRTIMNEEGALAALSGYDGIKLEVEKLTPGSTKEFYYIILDRGKVKVKA